VSNDILNGDPVEPELMDALFEKAPDKAGKTPAVPAGRAADGKFVAAAPEPKKEKVIEEPKDEIDQLLEVAEPAEGDEESEEQPGGAVVDDDYEIEVKVDDEPVKLTLKQLKEAYSGEKFIEKRIQQASEAKNIAEQQAGELYQTNQAQMQRLQQLDTILSGFAQPNIDWNALKMSDPLQYTLKREEAREAQDKQAQVRAEAQRLAGEQIALQERQQQEYLQREAQTLVRKMPDMADPEKARATMTRLTSAAKKYGFSDQEVGTVMDHRMLLVLADNAKYHDILARKEIRDKGITPAAPTKTMRVSSTAPVAAAPKKKEEVALHRARLTGSDDDVANFLTAQALTGARPRRALR
jgi:hypothetical protein